MEKIKVFIHIPKSGGTSMAKMLQQKYKTLFIYRTWQPGKYVFTDNYETIHNLLKEDNGVSINNALYYAKANGFEFILGNLSIPEIDHEFRRYWDTVEYYTCIRNPYDRMFSERCHDIRFGLDPANDNVYSERANTITKQIGSLENLHYYWLFENFKEGLNQLGLEEIHENASNSIRLLSRNQQEIERCNQLDWNIYAKAIEIF